MSDEMQSENLTSGNAPDMTPQQRRVRPDAGALAVYRELTVGNQGWGFLAGFEAYTFCCSNLSGLVGYGVRTVALPPFLHACGKRPTFGRGLCIRRPADISLGDGVIIDDYVTLDVRSMAHQLVEPGIFLGDCVFVGRQSIIAAKGGTVTLGAGSNISSCCRIATESSVKIGKSVLIAAYVYIGPGNHLRDDSGRPLISADMERKGGVTIGDHAWIGTRTTILDGVTIGANAVIGAHSLVREDVPPGAVVAGVPAKIIKAGN